MHEGTKPGGLEEPRWTPVGASSSHRPQVKREKADAVKQIMGLYEMFVKSDCTMVEVSVGGKGVACWAEQGGRTNQSVC